MADKYMAFSNPDTAKDFASLFSVDQWVCVPVQEPGCSCRDYTGMISDITPCAAKRYVAFGGNLLKKKEEAAANPDGETGSEK